MNWRDHNCGRSVVMMALAAVTIVAGSQAWAQHRCVSTPPPAGAVVLFDGKSGTSEWQRQSDKRFSWKVENGELVARDTPYSSITSKQEFGDYRLHLEFLIPPGSRRAGSGHPLCGVYLQGGWYEVQIADSFGHEPHDGVFCGAVRHQLAPDSNTSLPAGEWQSFDIYFHAARVTKDDKLESAARMTLYLNGGRIHDNVEIRPTCHCYRTRNPTKRTGTIRLKCQDFPVRFRNIWVQPLVEAPPPDPERIETMTVTLPGGEPMEFVLIKAGTVMMGAPEGEPDRGIDEAQHEVTLTKDFWLGRYEVTNRQFRAFRPDHMSCGVAGEKGDFNGDDQPAVTVALADVEAFLRWVAKRTGKWLRLPTEAEWEYACRAGGTGRWCFGEDPALLTDYAWYAGNSGWVTHPVGQKKPNRWGLYDMHGNVAEWVSDWHGYYPGARETDPTGLPAGGEHSWHESSWRSKPYECRCSQRDRSSVHYTSAALGFRVACDP